jgi:hypothetical protein
VKGGKASNKGQRESCKNTRNTENQSDRDTVYVHPDLLVELSTLLFSLFLKVVCQLLGF